MARRVLHLGPYQPALETALVAEVAAIRRDDPLRPVVVLAPTFLLCVHLKRMLAQALGGHSGVRFVNVQQLAEELGGPALRSEGLAPLPPLAEQVLWRRAVADVQTEFFAPIRDT